MVRAQKIGQSGIGRQHGICIVVLANESFLVLTVSHGLSQSHRLSQSQVSLTALSQTESQSQSSHPSHNFDIPSSRQYLLPNEVYQC